MKLEIDTNALLTGGALCVLGKVATVALQRSRPIKGKNEEYDTIQKEYSEIKMASAADDAAADKIVHTSDEISCAAEPSPEPQPEETHPEEVHVDQHAAPWAIEPAVLVSCASLAQRLTVLAVVFLVWYLMPLRDATECGTRGMMMSYDLDDVHEELGKDFHVHIHPHVTVDLEEQVLGTSSTSTRSAYYGTLQLGSPAVPYTFVFDTGSGHLILPSGYCHSQVCKMHKRYRRSASKTAIDIDGDGAQVGASGVRDQLQVQFGTGEITGVFVEDIVCMDSQVMQDLRTGNGSSAVALQAGTGKDSDVPQGCMRMRFLAATEMSQQPFDRFKFDGILGLGLSGLSQSPEFNFMHVLANSIKEWGSGGSEMPYTFGVFLAEAWEEKSQLALGGWESDHVDGDLFWNAVHKPELGHWIIKIKSLRVNGEVLSFCEEGCKAVVDTGTSLLSVPTQAFPEMYNLMRHDASLDGQCQGAGPQLHIELDHFTLTMGPEDYSSPKFYTNKDDEPTFGKAPFVSKQEGKNATRHDVYCQPMLMSMDLEEPIGPKLFILGEPVLRKYYTVYDSEVKRVGFGRAKHQPRPALEDAMEDLDESWFYEDDEDDEKDQVEAAKKSQPEESLLQSSLQASLRA